MSSDRQRLAMMLGRAPRVRLTTYDPAAKPHTTIARPVTRGEFVFVRVNANHAMITRLRHDPAMRVAPATSRGKARGPSLVATGGVVRGGIDEIVDGLIRWKYGWTARFDGPGSKRRPKAIVQITLEPDLAEHDDSPALRD